MRRNGLPIYDSKSTMYNGGHGKEVLAWSVIQEEQKQLESRWGQVIDEEEVKRHHSAQGAGVAKHQERKNSIDKVEPDRVSSCPTYHQKKDSTGKG